MVPQILSQLFNGLGVSPFGDEQHAPSIGVSSQGDVAVAPGTRGLINAQRRHIRVVGQAACYLHVFLAHRQYTVGRLAHDARHCSKWHLSGQHQDEGLEQQREAVKSSRKVRLDQPYRTIGQLHAWRAHLQVAFVLEEVQVSVALSHGVVHRMYTFVTRHRKAASRLEVNQHGQRLGSFVELNRCHRPRRCNPKGSFKLLGSHQFTRPG